MSTLRARWWFGLSLLVALASSAQASVPVREGSTAPGFRLPLLSPATGQQISLQAQRGKLVYVDFWASWCAPCRVSFPVLEKLRGEFRHRGFEVIAISVDEEANDAREFLRRFPVSYPVAHDPAGDTPARYGPLGMPTGYLVDPQGNVIAVHQGFRSSDEQLLRAMITRALERAGV